MEKQTLKSAVAWSDDETEIDTEKFEAHLDALAKTKFGARILGIAPEGSDPKDTEAYYAQINKSMLEASEGQTFKSVLTAIDAEIDAEKKPRVVVVRTLGDSALGSKVSAALQSAKYDTVIVDEHSRLVLDTKDEALPLIIGAARRNFATSGEIAASFVSADERRAALADPDSVIVDDPATIVGAKIVAPTFVGTPKFKQSRDGRKGSPQGPRWVASENGNTHRLTLGPGVGIVVTRVKGKSRFQAVVAFQRATLRMAPHANLSFVKNEAERELEKITKSWLSAIVGTEEVKAITETKGNTQ